VDDFIARNAYHCLKNKSLFLGLPSVSHHIVRKCGSCNRLPGTVVTLHGKG
jgi:hypothetical protein